MTRIRKAWRLKHEDYDDPAIVFAMSRNAAKASVFRDMVEYGGTTFGRAIDGLEWIRRAPELDVHLPEPHRLLADLTEDERDIVLHSFGCQGTKHGWREHFCTAPGDLQLLRLSWEFGLFSGPHGEKAYGETPGWSGAFFCLTDLGKAVALSMVPTYPHGDA